MHQRVDFKQRVFEPRDEVKGEVARVWFYMHDRYDLAMSEQQQKLLMVWDSEFPPSAAERERIAVSVRLPGSQTRL